METGWIMAGRFILTLSAIILFIAGIAGLVAPVEIARAIDGAASSALPIFIQLFGGSLIGFAAMDWMSRRNRIGGIYARPLGLGNLVLFATAALTLAKAASRGQLPPTLIGVGAAAGLLALSFAWLVFAHDPLSEGSPHSAG